jgi:iron complex outermembrane receptor protein
LYYYSNLANTLTPDTTIGGYTLKNARMEWNDIAGSRVHLAGFVRNLANKQSYDGGFSLGALVGINWVIPGLPRMYGLEVGVKF